MVASDLCDADVTCYLPPRGPVPREKMPGLMQRGAQHWEAHDLGIWSIRSRDDGSLIGHCGLLLNEPPQVELSCSAHKGACPP